MLLKLKKRSDIDVLPTPPQQSSDRRVTRISETPLRAERLGAALCLALTAGWSGSIHAHAVLDQKSALAGSYHRNAIRVGHGCDGSSTVAVTVRIPEGIRGAKPMPKPGWTIERRFEKLAQPYTSHGKTVTEEVVAITWRGGPLPDAHFDEFALQMQLPDKPGPIWFKVQQQCEKGEIDWATVPASGTSTRGIKAPAALLEVTPLPASTPQVNGTEGTPKASPEHKH